MASFSAQIIDLTGTISAGFDVTNALHAGVKDVIEKVAKYQPSELAKFSEFVVADNDGIDLNSTFQVLYVTRDLITCRGIPPQLSHKAGLAESVYAATNDDPVFYVEDNLLKVLPDPAGDAKSIASTEQGLTASYTQFNLSGLNPTEEYALGDWFDVSKTTDYNGKHEVYAMDSASITAKTPFVGSQTGVLSRMAGRARLINPSEVNGMDLLDTVENFPDSKIRGIVLFASMRHILFNMSDLVESMAKISISLQNLPPNLQLDSVSETIPTYSAPASFTLPTAPGDADIDFTGITEPVLLSVPSPPSPSITSGGIDLSTLTEPEYNNPVISNPDFLKITEYVQTHEDIELAQAQAGVISSQVAEFQAQIQNSANQYQNDAEVYKAQIQEQIHQQDHKLQEEQAQITSEMAKYQADVAKATQNYASDFQLYARKVQKAVETYGSETKYDIETYSAQISAETARHSNDLQSENQKFTNAMARFNADIQNISQSNQNYLAKFKSEIEAVSSDSQAKISKFSAELQKVGSKQQLLQSKYVLIGREYNEMFGVLTTEAKTPSEQKGVRNGN